MKRGPVSYRKKLRPKEVQDRIREIERAFHLRQFGEELTRVNFELTIEERHQYLEWMRNSARKTTAKQPSEFCQQDQTDSERVVSKK